MFSYLILFITLFCNVIAITSHVCAEAPVLAINLCDKDGTSDFALLNKQQTVPRPILQTKFVLKKRAAPWTHDPKCTEKLEHGRSYCVYTSDTFANGRGISIFTTPRAAKQIAALAAFNVPGALDDVKELQDVPWHTEVIPGRGIGMIADRELARGDRLTAYTPLLLMHEQLEAFVSRAELEQFLQIAVDQLPADSRRMLLSLQGSEDGGESTIKDIVATNSFEFLVGKDQQPHFFVYPETSRFNHDCRAK